MPRDVFAEQAYLFADPQEYDPKGVEKHLADPAILSHLQSYTTALASAEFEAAALEANLRECADAASIKAGQLIHPIRLGLTGRTVSPSLFDMMAVLGKETVVRRLNRLLRQFHTA